MLGLLAVAFATAAFVAILLGLLWAGQRDCEDPDLETLREEERRYIRDRFGDPD